MKRNERVVSFFSDLANQCTDIREVENMGPAEYKKLLARVAEAELVLVRLQEEKKKGGAVISAWDWFK